MQFFQAPTDTSRRIGQALRKRRISLDLTIDMVARSTGLAAPTIQRLETTGRGTIDTFVRIVEALDLQVEFNSFLESGVKLDIDAVLAEAAPRQRVRPKKRS
jgi:transcriptional regulator with XRE-family HTH domain